MLEGSAMPDEGSIKKAFEDEALKAFGVNDSLVEWASDEESRDDFEAKLMQVRPQDWQKFWMEDGTIDREYLAEHLTTKEKFTMLASHVLGDQIFSIFFSGKKDGVKTLSMEEAADYFTKNPDKGARKFGRNLVWDQSSPFSQIQTLFSLADLVTNKSETGQEAFPLVPGTFWFVTMAPAEAGPKLKPTLYSAVKKACDRVGVKLTFLRPGERPLHKPDLSKKEIQLSFLDQTLPTNADGTMDMKLLDWYVECYEMAPCMIMQGGPLLAAILKRQGEVATSAEALNKDHANYPGSPAIIALLDTVTKRDAAAPGTPDAPAAPIEAPKPASVLPKTPDGKVDRAKLEEYRIALGKGEAPWLTPYQKAGVYVLQGSPVEQALTAANVVATDPNYASVKADLESLNA